MSSKYIVSFLLALGTFASAQSGKIERRLPPPGIELSEAQRAEVAAARDHVAERLVGIPKDHPRRADVEVYHKAISYALEFGEFYKAGDLKAVRELVLAADKCADQLEAGTEPRHGLRVCGYRSSIDGSVQPYGLEVPEKLDLDKPVPLWIWLHGRGDKTTDLYFIQERLKKPGQFRPDNAIVIHPFGRQCLGWKSAGEIDVFEAVEDVAKRYKIDRDRIALMGFSMGGAGAWHIGAHYTEHFAAVHAGAGFAETARYNNLKPEDFPPQYEQVLWGLYDVPGYVRNLFNVPVLAYSGEIDKQIQAARVMEEAYAAEGSELQHIIGPKMGHKYDPLSREKVEQFVAGALDEGVDRFPQSVSLQTRTLRYHRLYWIAATGLVEHWKDSRINARRNGSAVTVSTKNISDFSFLPGTSRVRSISVDGTELETPATAERVYRLHRVAGGAWHLGRPARVGDRKRPYLQGPIDDAFMAPFLVVLPTTVSPNPKVQAWVQSELAHFEQRWRATFRGELRKKTADQLTAADLRDFHLIAFGDPASNPLIAGAVKTWTDLDWDTTALRFAGKELPSAKHLPLLVRPNPKNPRKYLVINSGPTFREGHDRTNSLQNPKLPDWALIDLDQVPDALTPGKIVAAGFFDEEWKLK